MIPGIEWMSHYKREYVRGDITAGLTVGIMLIPQGMAYAMIAGLPPIYGLYASTVPLIIYALLGTSRQLAVGPVAMVSLLTATGVSTLAAVGSEDYIALAIILALMIGVMQFVLGLLRLGFLVSFLSHPVLSGFTSAAALIIGFSQLKHLMGVDLPRSHHVHEIFMESMNHISETNLYTLAIGLTGIAVILLAKRYTRNVPGPLLAVFFGILVTVGLGLDAYGVKIIGDIPSGLPSLTIPSVEPSLLRSLLPIALAISLVSFMESIAIAKAIQAKHKDYELNANQELIGLGVANIIGSLFQSYPVTGGFGRTAVNDQAGARSGLAPIISASFIILTLLFLTPLFYYLPKAILASVIMVAVVGLIDLKEAKLLWKVDRKDFWMLFITFIATLTLGIELGIGIGVLLSLALIVHRSSRPHIAVLGRVPQKNVYRNVERFNGLIIEPEVLILRVDSELYFANIEYIITQVKKEIASRQETIRAVVLHSGSISHVDSSAMHSLKELNQWMGEQEIDLYFSGLIGPVRDIFTKNKYLESKNAPKLFLNVKEALDYLHRTQERLSDYSYQTNVSK